MMDDTWKNAVRSAVPTPSYKCRMFSVMVTVENATMPR